LGVISFFSLGSGFLTGKYRSKEDLSNSARGSFVEKYLNERGFRIVEALERAAQQQNLTPAQVALAWLMAQPTITAPIASATNLDQLNELIEAATVELDSAAIDLLNQAST
jgi:aryl-alcohol dehydrogenase-like predicted oxidoreductase